MRIVLVKPNIGRMEHSLYVDEARMEPLQLGLLAALTPSWADVRLIDDRMEQVPYDESVDLAVITVETYTARRAYEIADEYRRRKVKVVLGGMHASLAPEEMRQHCDTLYIGDAEPLWEKLIQDASEGKLAPEYRGEPGIPQYGRMIRRDLFRSKGYLPIQLMQYSRGCNHSCTFCATSVYFNSQHHVRPVDDVIRELEMLDRKVVFFVDDNITADVNAAKELFRALIPLKIHWVSQSGIDMVKDPELMELMAKSGCLGHVVGFESINRKNLISMNKGTSIQNFAGYKEPLDILRSYGMQTWAAFTLGHDFDTPDSVKRTLEFAIQNKFAFAAFNILMPYPGTPLYENLKSENRLLYDGHWWLHPDYRFNHAAFIPRGMTPDQLTESCLEARKAFNSPASIFYRALDHKTHLRSPYRLALYAMYNPLFRKEVYKKQGMRFGLNPK